MRSQTCPAGQPRVFGFAVPKAPRGRRILVGTMGVLAASAALALCGCEHQAPEPLAVAKTPPAADALLSVGTVGAETLITNGTPWELRGFGLVVGLNGRGSGDCPTAIRQYLEDWLGKQIPPQGAGKRKLPTPGELIDSPDPAVVEVVGAVPPGARKGTRFDLQVRAMPGTSTQSLEGGLLLPTEMRNFDRSASGQGLIAGAVLAHANGPVVIRPLLEQAKDPNDRAEGDAREGLILGGGRTIDERVTRLMLVHANYARAKAIQNRINERFGQRLKIATAFSAQQVDVTTPAMYERQYERFRMAMAQLYLDNRPAVLEQKLRELSTRAATPGADLERIGATWEALGQMALPQVQLFYTDKAPLLRLYAARTGLRLGDATALPILAEFAARGAREQRLIAIRELGFWDSPQAAPALAPLLNNADQEVRIAAYEALLQRGYNAIHSLPFAHVQDPQQINFALDVVDSSGPALIYVRRSRLPRIAVFGSRMPVSTPLFYTEPDDSVTINNPDGSSDVQLFAKRNNRLTDAIILPPRVVDLITALADLPKKDDAGRLRGIGLPFSRVIQVLLALTRDESVPARLVFEQTGAADLLAPQYDTERPEAERAETDRADAERAEANRGEADAQVTNGEKNPAAAQAKPAKGKAKPAETAKGKAKPAESAAASKDRSAKKPAKTPPGQEPVPEPLDDSDWRIPPDRIPDLNQPVRPPDERPESGG